MNQKIKVSVYCLAYNHEKYICDALEGFVSQVTDFGYEVFVHDDASTDNTAKIIAEYEEKYPEIIKPVYQKENQYSQGVRIAQTFLFPKFSGEYVAICEGDDYWTSPDKLQKQADFLDHHPDYSACAHNSEVLHLLDGTKELRNTAKEDYDCSVDELLSRLIEGKRQPWQLSGLMYRRCCLAHQPFFFTAMKTFGDLSLDLFLLSYGKVRFFADIMSVYRMGTETSLKRQADPSHKKLPEERIALYENFNEYTGFRYAEKLHILIMRDRYDQYCGEGEYKRLLEGELGDLFRQRPLRHKVKVYAMCYCPQLYTHVKALVKTHLPGLYKCLTMVLRGKAMR